MSLQSLRLWFCDLFLSQAIAQARGTMMDGSTIHREATSSSMLESVVGLSWTKRSQGSNHQRTMSLMKTSACSWGHSLLDSETIFGPRASNRTTQSRLLVYRFKEIQHLPLKVHHRQVPKLLPQQIQSFLHLASSQATATLAIGLRRYVCHVKAHVCLTTSDFSGDRHLQRDQ
jgi:hypothetical protein